MNTDACRPTVRRLELQDFRNYRSLRLDLPERPVVLVGANGAGKTNLIEALSLLSPGRGLRRARYADLTRHGATAGWTVAVRLACNDGEVRLGTGLVADDERAQRTVRMDGEKSSPGRLLDVLGVQWLTPQMDRLFLEGAAPRRRYLDRLVLAFDQGHGARVSAYDKTLRERARLLRDGRMDQTWLKVLEERLAGDGVAVAAARNHAVARLSRVLAEAQGAFPGAVLEARGSLEGWLREMPAVEVEARFLDRLRANRPVDAETGGAADGPHRSDFMVFHARKGVPASQCSTGEQKALLLAIQLATARLEAARRGLPPLLLLDEVSAHLDAERRAALFDELSDLGGQVWMTGTDRSLFDPLTDRAAFARVDDGRVTLED